MVIFQLLWVHLVASPERREIPVPYGRVDTQRTTVWALSLEREKRWNRRQAFGLHPSHWRGNQSRIKLMLVCRAFSLLGPKLEAFHFILLICNLCNSSCELNICQMKLRQLQGSAFPKYVLHVTCFIGSWNKFLSSKRKRSIGSGIAADSELSLEHDLPKADIGEWNSKWVGWLRERQAMSQALKLSVRAVWEDSPLGLRE